MFASSFAVLFVSVALAAAAGARAQQCGANDFVVEKVRSSPKTPAVSLPFLSSLCPPLFLFLLPFLSVFPSSGLCFLSFVCLTLKLAFLSRV
jgi:hypothetical protein